MDESLLPPPAAPAKPVPWRAMALAIVPCAALAAGTGLQRAIEAPGGDALAHWLLWSTGAGVLIGATAGALRRAKFVWAAYGAAAPWMAAGLVMAALHVARPVREMLADHLEASCRAERRAICSVGEFDAACARADRRLLGEPVHSRCSDASCTWRWTYAGPFRPEQVPPRGSLMCSVVTDARGKGLRSTVMAVAGPAD